MLVKIHILKPKKSSMVKTCHILFVRTRLIFGEGNTFRPQPVDVTLLSSR